MSFKLFDRVQETSTSTGTGDLTLGGAVTGFSTFSSRYSTGDTLYYGIHAVNGAGVPTGEWEIGLGTYSAANTLTRTTVMSSSNSDSSVSFSAGSKHVFVTMTALQGASIREALTADRAYYVRTDGSNSNNGLANTSGGAFLTIQKAVDTIMTLDCRHYNVTVNVGDGTYTGSTVLYKPQGTGVFTVRGNSSTPSNVLISVTSGNGFSAYSSGASWSIKDLKIATTTSGWAFESQSGASLTISNIDFGVCASGHIYSDTLGYVTVNGNYAISGAAPVHIQIGFGSQIYCYSKTITITGTPAFSYAFIISSHISTAYMPYNTYSGSATGKRYEVSSNSVVNVGGGGTTYFPGNVSGTTATGGQYA